MEKITFKDGFGFIYLNKNIYSKKVIISTFKVYLDFFEGSILELKDKYIIKIIKKENDYSTEDLTWEFLNYLISVEYESLNKNKK